jgi:uncharacterized glyoxalase superfamily protein PhnB
VTPRIVVNDVDAQVAFLREVFDATGEIPQGRPAEIRVGDSLIMVTSAAERDLFAAFLYVYVYVDDADATYQRALNAGAESLEEPIDTPYGDRRAMVCDPQGNIFQIAHQLLWRRPTDAIAKCTVPPSMNDAVVRRDCVSGAPPSLGRRGRAPNK